MIPLDYLALRLARRHVPGWLMRRLLRQGRWVLPGIETLAPSAAATRFARALAGAGSSVAGARVLILGYGGHFGVGVALLRRGATHVVLLDPYAEPNREANLRLARRNPWALGVRDGWAVPDPARITLVNAPVEQFAAERPPPVDLVLSNSVLEHVADVDGVVAALGRLTGPAGRHLHLIDLRDHLFRYPFEMLCHGRALWNGLLDPPSHLNRLRIPDYERCFEAHFEDVRWRAIASDEPAFRRARRRIRPEFLTGDDRLDAITRIELHARGPRAR
jgi:SAM-dependent methyltransferase